VPTATWERLDARRRAAVVAAAEAEFGAHGFSAGSLNVIARQAGVAKGSLFQYFTDKLDLFAYISDEAGARVRAHMVEVAAGLREGRTFFEFLTELLEEWVAYFAAHPRERSLTAAVNLEVDAAARETVRSVVNRHYLEVLGPWLVGAREAGELREDADLDALLALLLLIAPHLALAPFSPGLDPVLGLAAGGPEQPGLAIRRLITPLVAAFAAPAPPPTGAPSPDTGRGSAPR
jgi:AcrR family transcriptional regulator